MLCKLLPSPFLHLTNLLLSASVRGFTPSVTMTRRFRLLLWVGVFIGDIFWSCRTTTRVFFCFPVLFIPYCMVIFWSKVFLLIRLHGDSKVISETATRSLSFYVHIHIPTYSPVSCRRQFIGCFLPTPGECEAPRAAAHRVGRVLPEGTKLRSL